LIQREIASHEVVARFLELDAFAQSTPM
jgi:hypothetical protein